MLLRGEWMETPGGAMAEVALQSPNMEAFPRDAQHNAHIEHMFDPWLTCSNKLAQAVAANLSASWDLVAPPRQRVMRAVDRKNLQAVIQALAANFAYSAAIGVWPPSFGVSLRAEKQPTTRYDRPGFKGLPRILRMLASPDLSMIRLEKSHTKGTASRVTASPIFLSEYRTLKAFGLGSEKFGQVLERETIYLSRKTRDYAADLEERELINYAPNPEADCFRSELLQINRALEGADIGMAPDDGPPVITSIRLLRRYFNLPADAPEGTERFDLGGRLFGGWWQSLPSERRRAIRIQGEPIADLDFAAMFLRLAYVEVGEEPPSGDLYAAVPGLAGEQWRLGLKKFTLAMLCRSTPITRFPKGTREEFPARRSASDVREAILAAHPALEPIFESGAGLRLMFRESQVLVAALLALAGEGVPALPMHDGLMVARSKADRVAAIMGDAAEAVTGYRLPIVLKSLY